MPVPMQSDGSAPNVPPHLEKKAQFPSLPQTSWTPGINEFKRSTMADGRMTNNLHLTGFHQISAQICQQHKNGCIPGNSENKTDADRSLQNGTHT